MPLPAVSLTGGCRARRADFVVDALDAIEQALCDRRPVRHGGLVHHSDRGVQYVLIRYGERLLEAGMDLPSAASATATTVSLWCCPQGLIPAYD
jgi:putative transposase